MFLAAVSVPINLEHRDNAANHLCSDTFSRSEYIMLMLG